MVFGLDWSGLLLFAGMAGLAVSLGLLSLSRRLKRGRSAMIAMTLMLGAASITLIGFHVAQRMGS
jgi:hypothetical protein